MRTETPSFVLPVLGAMLGFAIGLLVFGAFAVQALYNDPTTHSGEKLQFLGSILGSALGVGGAVAGALLIEEIRRRREREASRRPLIEALLQAHGTMVQAVESADRVLGDDEGAIDVATERQRAIDLLASIDDAMVVLDITEKSAGVRTVGELLALHALRKALGELQPIVAYEQVVVARHGPSVAILKIFYDKVRDKAAALTPKLNRARNAISS